MTTQREAFEEFYGNYQKPLVPDALDKNADGEYKHYFTRDALAIWQAANAIQSHSGVEAVGRIERNSSSKYTFIFNDEYIGEGKLLADGTELYLANPDQIVRIKEQQAEITRLTALVESYKGDAERYRWLRDKSISCDTLPTAWCVYGESGINSHPCDDIELDEAIDAAMKDKD